MIEPPLCGKVVGEYGLRCLRFPGHLGNCNPGFPVPPNRPHILSLMPRRVIYIGIAAGFVVWVQMILDIIIVIKLWG